MTALVVPLILVFAAPDVLTAGTTVEQAVDELKDLPRDSQLGVRLAAVLNRTIDYDRVAATMLDGWWKEATKEQKQEVKSLIAQLVAAQGCAVLTRTPNLELRCRAYATGSTTVTLSCKATLAADEVKVWLYLSRQERWQVYDAKIWGQSVVKSMRPGIRKAIRVGGYTGLVIFLETLTEPGPCVLQGKSIEAAVP